jgi:hypothetical protein
LFRLQPGTTPQGEQTVTTVRTTEPLGIRRMNDGDIVWDILPTGSLCELACEDDTPGTFILIDEHGDEAWLVRPAQFEPVEN